MCEYNLSDMLLRIKTIKKERKITNEQLSYKTRISLGTLSKILTGVTKEPSIESMLKIAKALEVPAEYLILGNVEKKEQKLFLDENEKKLLSAFRELSTQGQEYILQTIDMAKYKYKKDILPSNTEDVG